MEQKKHKTVAVTVDVAVVVSVAFAFAVAVADSFRCSWKTDSYAVVVSRGQRRQLSKATQKAPRGIQRLPEVPTSSRGFPRF